MERRPCETEARLAGVTEERRRAAVSVRPRSSESYWLPSSCTFSMVEK